MKHRIVDDVKVDFEFNKEDVESVIDKITDSAITLIVVSTAAHVVKSYFSEGKSLRCLIGSVFS